MAIRSLFQGGQLKPAADIIALMSRLGHEFDRTELLIRALTHGSVATPTRPDNQRLEFLGDRVLGLVMAEALFFADPNASEGRLAPRFNALVKGETCAAIAREIGLGDVLKLGRSEMLSGGRRKEALLADAMEAVLAAVYLDAGFDAAKTVILGLWASRIAGLDDDPRDPKTMLQEWAQANGMGPPDYELINRGGADHAPVFFIRATLENGQSAEASGAGTKRSIEQAAAKALLDKLADKK